MTEQPKQSSREHIYAVTVRHHHTDHLEDKYPFNYLGSLRDFVVGRNEEDALRKYSREHFSNHEQTEELFNDLRKQFRLVKVEVPDYEINLEERVLIS